MIAQELLIRQLGSQPYESCWRAMQQFTQNRDSTNIDEFWIVEHPPVFTQGQNGKPEHILNPHTIPVILSDRGGQVTYHGPGQLVIYTLINVTRKNLTIRQLVNFLEDAVIRFLAEYDIQAVAQSKAPGVYVDGQKICSIGLRIKRGSSYHGLALNYDMDLSPFKFINPCGYTDLPMTQIKDLKPDLCVKADTIALKLIQYLAINLGYTTIHSL